MPITQSEAIRISSEARSRGDRETAKKYSQIARYLQRGEEDKLFFYDQKTGRVQHNTDTALSDPDRYVLITKGQVKDVRDNEPRQEMDGRSLMIPEQRVEQQGRVLYRVTPVNRETFTLSPGAGDWKVQYDLGYGQREKVFTTQEEAEQFTRTLKGTREYRNEEASKFTDPYFDAIYGIQEYLKGVAGQGPPRPSFEQQMRGEAGIPQQGLPGPGVTRTGSIKEKMEGFTGDVLDNTEKPFKAITGSLRNVEAMLDKLSVDALSTTTTLQPSTQFGTKISFDKTSPVEVEKRAQPELGFGAYLGGVAVATGVTAVDVATFQYRPGLWVESARGVAGILTDADMRTQAIMNIAKDPFKAVTATVGGTFIGSPGLTRQTQDAIKRTTSKMRKYFARDNLREVFDETLFPFESELGYFYPEEIGETKTTLRGFEKNKITLTDPFKKPSQSRSLPLDYYSKLDDIVDDIPKQQIRGDPDTWTPNQVAEGLDELTLIDTGQGTALIQDRVKGNMKPMNYAETVTETAKPKLPELKLEKELGVIKDVLQRPAHRAALYGQRQAGYDYGLVTIRGKTVSGIAGISSVKGISVLLSKDMEAVNAVLRKSEQSVKVFAKPAVFTGSKPKTINIVDVSLKNALGSVQTLMSKTQQTQVEKQVFDQFISPQQTQRQTQISTPIQIQLTEQIQIPQPVPPPTPPGFKFPDPPKIIRLPPFKVKKKKKKRKKRKGKVKGVYELRVDKKLDKLLKEFKI